MQTFLPYKSFNESAQCLDYRRLGKQRIEAKQLLQILLSETDKKGWRNHPALLMWKGYENSLAYYGMIICEEWIRRGYKDNQLDYFKERSNIDNVILPHWLDDNFTKSHRSNLLRKDKEFYSKYGWDVPDDLEYIWPTKIK
jgi:hypothetical protein